MSNYNFFLLFAIILLIISCTKKPEQVSVIKEKKLYSQMSEAYNDGLKALEDGDVLFAAKNLMKQKFYTLNQNLHPKLLLWQRIHIILKIIIRMQLLN